MAQILYTHVYKWKNETCCNYYRNGGVKGLKENHGRVNSRTIGTIYCENFCEGHNVPPVSTTIKSLKTLKKHKKQQRTW
jgi:hypothetical protein